MFTSCLNFIGPSCTWKDDKKQTSRFPLGADVLERGSQADCSAGREAHRATAQRAKISAWKRPGVREWRRNPPCAPWPPPELGYGSLPSDSSVPGLLTVSVLRTPKSHPAHTIHCSLSGRSHSDAGFPSLSCSSPSAPQPPDFPKPPHAICQHV